MASKKESVAAAPRGSVAAAARASVATTSDAVGSSDAASALGLTPEVWFDPNKEEALEAKEAQERLEIRALPVRQYLEASVVPLLLHGLQLLAIERPENPVEFLAQYLIEKNPMKVKEEVRKEEKKEEKKEEEENKEGKDAKKEEKKEEKDEKK